jgi:hypothetical protein
MRHNPLFYKKYSRNTPTGSFSNIPEKYPARVIDVPGIILYSITMTAPATIEGALVLNERIQFIDHQGKEILLLDFSNREPDEVLQIIHQATAVIETRAELSLLTLTDVTNARFNEAVGQGMKNFTLHNKPYVRAGAVIGITGLKRIIFGAVMAFSERKLLPFDDREQAKAWLITA